MKSGAVLYLIVRHMQQEVITALKAKDSRAFKQMYETYIRYVYSIVIRYHSESSNHQDIIQEVFANVFLKIHTYEQERGEFKGWLRAITVNQCLKYHRKSNREIQTSSLEVVSPKELPKEVPQEEISREDLLTILSLMPTGYKEVFMLIVIDGFTHKEAGQMLNISPETSRSQLHRAKLWLKENFNRNTSNALYNVLQR